jgi:hypothetical protein
MSDSQPLVLSAGHGLNLERAESFVAELGKVPTLGGEVEIDLQDCAHVDVGSGWRVGNALRRSRENFYLRVRIPDPRGYSGWWFQHFTRSGLGMAIARYADAIFVGREEITKQFRLYYDTPRLVGTPLPGFEKYLWQAENFCLVNSLENGVMNPDDVGEFGAVILKLLQKVSFDEAAYRKEDIQQLFDLVFQSVQNVYDHASKKPLPSETPILSYISLRYYRGINPPKSKTSELSTYLESLRSQPARYEFTGFIELVVNDDGAGIAARHSLDPNIYWGNIEYESEVLVRALQAGQSVKLRSKDALVRGDPGYGTSRIEAALKSLEAFALLRTGRLALVLDPLKSSSFTLIDSSYGYMPGTTLQIVLPCRRRVLWSDT